jgi:hypothetical protein
LPKGNKIYHQQDTGWDNTKYLEVNDKTVRDNFADFVP